MSYHDSARAALRAGQKLLYEGECAGVGDEVCCIKLSLPFAVTVRVDHHHVAASSIERREPRLDRGGLRLCKRVVVELQNL